MKLLTFIADKKYLLDTEIVYSIAIPLKFNGPQPQYFGAEPAQQKPMKAGEFIGDTRRGGSCNVDVLTMSPHCNGTHTESIHHIVDENINIGRLLNHSLSSCLLITVKPLAAAKTKDSYRPALNDTDLVIDLKTLQKAIDLDTLLQVEALVIRTLPNSSEKRSQVYNSENQPIFFTKQAMSWLAKSRLKHLLVDFPSVDRMYDEGKLSNHRLFWNVKKGVQKFNEKSKTERTITEMVFVKDHIEDGLYVLNLQVPAFDLDAAPSRPLLYPLEPLSSKTSKKSNTSNKPKESNPSP